MCLFQAKIHYLFHSTLPKEWTGSLLMSFLLRNNQKCIVARKQTSYLANQALSRVMYSCSYQLEYNAVRNLNKWYHDEHGWLISRESIPCISAPHFINVGRSDIDYGADYVNVTEPTL